MLIPSYVLQALLPSCRNDIIAPSVTYTRPHPLPQDGFLHNVSDIQYTYTLQQGVSIVLNFTQFLIRSISHLITIRPISVLMVSKLTYSLPDLVFLSTYICHYTQIQK